jgi:hypothetical protein
MAPKRFTRHEADELLPYLAPALFKLQGMKRKHDELRQQLGKSAGKSRSNGHGVDQEAARTRSEIEAAAEQISKLVEKVQSMGVELKDMDIGLVDFRTIREGREVYLCWKLGEETVSFWHELDTGYAGRQPLGMDE